MRLSVEESALSTVTVLLGSIATCIVLLRLLVHLLWRVLSHIRVLQGKWGFVIEAVVIALSVVLSVDTGLLLSFFVVALTFTLIVSWSKRSFVSIFVFTFAVLCMLGVPLLSSFVTLQIQFSRPADQRLRISAFYKGEHLVLREDYNHRPERQFRFLYVFHDDVSIDTEDVAHAPPASLNHNSTLPFWDTQRRLVSIGERTKVSRLRDISQIVLAGVEGLIEHSTLNCFLHTPLYPSASVNQAFPCLAAAAPLRVSNFTLMFHLRVDNEVRNASLHIVKATSCTEVVQQYSALEAQLKTMNYGLDLHPGLIRCRDSHIGVESFLKELSIHSDFFDAMPFWVAWRLRFPDYSHALRQHVIIFYDYVWVPIGKIAIAYAGVLCRGLYELSSRAALRSKACLPYIQLASYIAMNVLKGFLCSSNTCVHTLYDDKKGFLLGLKLRECLAAGLQAAADTVELVPGVWVFIRWVWKVKCTLVKSLLQNGWLALRYVAGVVLVPLARCLGKLALHLIAGALQLLTILSDVARRMHMSALLKGMGHWIYEEELRELQVEVRALRLCIVHARWLLAIVIQRTAGCLHLLWIWGKTLLRWYDTTSFSIHFSVFILQTVFLSYILRIKLQELAQQQDQKGEHVKEGRELASTTGRAETLFLKYVPRRLFQHSLFTKVGGVALIIKMYYNACLHYMVQHGGLFILLVGLSVLPFTSKLYRLTLHYVLPWTSSQLFLSFFMRPKPTYTIIAAMFAVKVVLAVVLQRTIGDFVYCLIKDTLIALSVFICLVGLIWAWPQRNALLRRASIEIGNSLHSTNGQQTAPIQRNEETTITVADGSGPGRS